MAILTALAFGPMHYHDAVMDILILIIVVMISVMGVGFVAVLDRLNKMLILLSRIHAQNSDRNDA